MTAPEKSGASHSGQGGKESARHEREVVKELIKSLHTLEKDYLNARRQAPDDPPLENASRLNLIPFLDGIYTLESRGSLEKPEFQSALLTIGADPIIRFAMLPKINASVQIHEQDPNDQTGAALARDLRIGKALGMGEAGNNSDFQTAAAVFTGWETEYQALQPIKPVPEPTEAEKAQLAARERITRALGLKSPGQVLDAVTDYIQSGGEGSSLINILGPDFKPAEYAPYARVSVELDAGLEEGPRILAKIKAIRALGIEADNPKLQAELAELEKTHRPSSPKRGFRWWPFGGGRTAGVITTASQALGLEPPKSGQIIETTDAKQQELAQRAQALQAELERAKASANYAAILQIGSRMEADLRPLLQEFLAREISADPGLVAYTEAVLAGADLAEDQTELREGLRAAYSLGLNREENLTLKQLMAEFPPPPDEQRKPEETQTLTAEADDEFATEARKSEQELDRLIEDLIKTMGDIRDIDLYDYARNKIQQAKTKKILGAAIPTGKITGQEVYRAAEDYGLKYIDLLFAARVLPGSARLNRLTHLLDARTAREIENALERRIRLELDIIENDPQPPFGARKQWADGWRRHFETEGEYFVNVKYEAREALNSLNRELESMKILAAKNPDRRTSLDAYAAGKPRRAGDEAGNTKEKAVAELMHHFTRGLVRPNSPILAEFSRILEQDSFGELTAKREAEAYGQILYDCGFKSSYTRTSMFLEYLNSWKQYFTENEGKAKAAMEAQSDVGDRMTIVDRTNFPYVRLREEEFNQPWVAESREVLDEFFKNAKEVLQLGRDETVEGLAQQLEWVSTTPQGSPDLERIEQTLTVEDARAVRSRLERRMYFKLRQAEKDFWLRVNPEEFEAIKAWKKYFDENPETKSELEKQWGDEQLKGAF